MHFPTGPRKLRHQLLVALVLPAVLVVIAIAWVADLVLRRALDDALGDRLCAVAESAATFLPARILALEAGDEDARTTKNAIAKLDALATATGVERIFVVRSSDHRAVLDSAGRLRIGEEYSRARFDRQELDLVARGTCAASVLFEGDDGKAYKTGYAPFRDEDATIAAVVGVDTPASYVATIDDMRRTSAAIALVGIVVLAITAMLSARRVSIPLSRLSRAAASIGEGKLDTPIPTGGPEEAAILAETMGAMTCSLRARDEEMQLMLAGIAHEVRNPLGGIELFCGLLKEDLPEGDPRQKHVGKIARELGVLSRVVNDFLDYARRREPELIRTNVGELLAEVVALTDAMAKEKQARIEVDVTRAIEATVDNESMKRAILNLVQNAIQAVEPAKGVVRIEAHREDDADAIEIVVDDNGPGIPSEHLRHVFRPFYTTKQKGTGLGLALVEKTITAHRGKVEATSSPSGGARFRISLPLSRGNNRDTA